MRRALFNLLFLLVSSVVYGQADTLLVFSFDNSSNQIKRKFVIYDDDGNPTDRVAVPNQYNIDKKKEQFLTISPNPTMGLAQVWVSPKIREKIISVRLYSSDSSFSFIDSYTEGDEYIQLDLSHNINGIYKLVAILNDGKQISANIIKL